MEFWHHEYPKIDGQFHPSDRIVKVVQIQTGGGKIDEENISEENSNKESEKDSDTESSTTSNSSISLEFEDQSIPNPNLTDSKKRKEQSPENTFNLEKEENRPIKKIKTYGLRLVD